MGNCKYKTSIENNIHFDEFTFGEVQDYVFNWYFFTLRESREHYIFCVAKGLR